MNVKIYVIKYEYVINSYIMSKKVIKYEYVNYFIMSKKILLLIMNM